MKYRIAKKIAADKPRSGQLRDVRHRLDTIAHAIARLRKAWRHRNPLDQEERSRRTGLDNNGDPRLSNGERLHPRRWVPDFFLSNQLASRYARLHYLRNGGKVRRYPEALTIGRPRSLG